MDTEKQQTKNKLNLNDEDIDLLIDCVNLCTEILNKSRKLTNEILAGEKTGQCYLADHLKTNIVEYNTLFELYKLNLKNLNNGTKSH